jgi:hypothetical protein
MRLAVWLVGAALAVAPGLAAADEPTGCDAFKWPLDHERAALMNSGKPAVANGGSLTADAAATLKLAPFTEAGLPHAPERAPRSPQSYAGHFALAAPAKAGIYKITIASEGWIDVIDAGQLLRPKAFSGVLGCEGARKSLKFDLPARPLDLQLSGVRNGEISLIVSPE